MPSHSNSWVELGSSQDGTRLEELSESLKEMPINMLVFSTCMRSLYVDKAVGTNQKAAKEFRKLRDETRNDAMVYLKGILPLSKRLIATVQDFFENYIVLNYEVWMESLPDIVDNVKGYKELCITVMQLHEDILVPLKKRQDQAKLVMSELKELQSKFEKRKLELECSADKKRHWKGILSYVPVVNMIACPILKAAADIDLTKAIADGAEAQVQEEAALAVAECLMPALEGFIQGLQRAAGFFSLMESQLGMFAEKGQESLDRPKELHFRRMNAKAKELKSHCEIFMTALPSIRTDFQAIPTVGTDQNYVDRWLEKQKEIIEKNCTVTSVLKGILSAIQTGGNQRS